MSRRCRALFPHPRQPTAGARSSQPQCQVLHAKPACGLTVRMAVEPATSAKATAASPRNFFMGVSSLNRLLPRLPLAVQVVCDRQHKKTHLAGTRVPLGGSRLTWRRSRFRAVGNGAGLSVLPQASPRTPTATPAPLGRQRRRRQPRRRTRARRWCARNAVAIVAESGGRALARAL
jgi:hypothetical protein